MKNNIIEIIIGTIVLVTFIILTLSIFNNSPRVNNYKQRMINITALAEQGMFTEEEVNAENYLFKKFKRANILICKGEDVIFRFSSADVTHSFYVPELGLGPITIEAGHYYDVPFRASSSGKFSYYCMSVCGPLHNYMRGNFIVIDSAQLGDNKLIDSLKQDLFPFPENINAHLKFKLTKSFVENGRMLFNDKGCFLCHGEGGKGGVANPNYALKFVPKLITIANKLKLSDKSEADSVIKYLENDANLEELNDNPPFPSYARFYAQYQSITAKIRDGAPVVQKLDTSSFVPPLCMPSWEHHLTTRQINSILAYLIYIYDWDEN